MKEIHIQPVLNGFIVKIGCTKIVFTDTHKMCMELKRYQAAPEQIEKEYLASALNRPDQTPAVASNLVATEASAEAQGYAGETVRYAIEGAANVTRR